MSVFLCLPWLWFKTLPLDDRPWGYSSSCLTNCVCLCYNDAFIHQLFHTLTLSCVNSLRVDSFMRWLFHGLTLSWVDSFMGRLFYGLTLSSVDSFMGWLFHGSTLSWVDSFMGWLFHGLTLSCVNSFIHRLFQTLLFRITNIASLTLSAAQHFLLHWFPYLGIPALLSSGFDVTIAMTCSNTQWGI